MGAWRVRSSSRMRLSLPSTSSRRHRISERLLSEVITSQHRRKRPRPEGDGGHASRGHLAERIGNVELNPLRSALLCRPYVGPNASLVARPPSADLFTSAKDLFVEAKHGWPANCVTANPLSSQATPRSRRVPPS